MDAALNRVPPPTPATIVPRADGGAEARVTTVLPAAATAAATRESPRADLRRRPGPGRQRERGIDFDPELNDAILRLLDDATGADLQQSRAEALLEWRAYARHAEEGAADGAGAPVSRTA